MRILLDVDGVFADFTVGSYAAHGKTPIHTTTWDYFKEWTPSLSGSEFWAPINDHGENFYKALVPAYPWCEELLATVKKFSTDLAILTANHGTPGGFAGKKWWCNTYLPGIPVAVVDHAFPKEQLAKGGTILIDDRNENVDRFSDAGGWGILFPQPWNRLNESTDDRVGHVARSLHEVFDRSESLV